MNELFWWYQTILCLKSYSFVTSRSLECAFFFIDAVFLCVYACTCVGGVGMVRGGVSISSDPGEEIFSEGN